MPDRTSKPRKLDVNQLAKAITDKTTAEQRDPVDPKRGEPKKNPAAVELGRLGGLKGGKARARALPAEKRAQIAREAARKRWEKRKG